MLKLDTSQIIIHNINLITMEVFIMSRIADFELQANEDMRNRFQELKEEIQDRNIIRTVKEFNEQLEELNGQLDVKEEELKEIQSDIEDIKDDIENVQSELQSLNNILEEYDASKNELEHL